MKNKKSLLSVLLAAVLLCACVAGMLVFGASAEATTEVYVVDGVGGSEDAEGNPTFATIKEALAEAAKSENAPTWAAGSSLEIRLTADQTPAVESSTVLFGAKTVFIADNTKLPITIVSAKADNSNAVITLASNTDSQLWTASNDYTFKDLTLAITKLSKYHRFLAGSGNVVMNNVTFTGTGSDATTNAGLFADAGGKTAAFDGWTQANVEAEIARYTDESKGKLRTSITLHDTDYVPCEANNWTIQRLAGRYGAANWTKDLSGFTLSNEMTEARFVVSGTSSVGRLVGLELYNTSYNFPGKTVLEVKDGTVQGICADSSSASYNFKNTVHNAKIDIIVSGGTVNRPHTSPYPYSITCGTRETFGANSEINVYLEGDAELKGGIYAIGGNSNAKDKNLCLAGTVNIYLNGGVGTNVYGATSETANHSVSSTGKINIVYNGTALSGGIYGWDESGAVSGEVSITLKKNKTSSSTKVQALSNGTVEAGGKVGIKIDGNVSDLANVFTLVAGTVKTNGEVYFQLDDGTLSTNAVAMWNDAEAQWVAESGAVIATRFNGGVYSVENCKVYDKNYAVSTGLSSDAIFRMEWNGTVPFDSSTTNESAKANYRYFSPIQSATIPCNVEMVITDLSTEEMNLTATTSGYEVSRLDRWINASVINGDVTLIVDTTEDGWKMNADGTRASDDSDVNKEGAVVALAGFQDWSSSTKIGGHARTYINGGAGKTVSFNDFQYLPGTQVTVLMENCTASGQVGLSRGNGQGSQAQDGSYAIGDVSLSFKNVVAAGLYTTNTSYSSSGTAGNGTYGTVVNVYGTLSVSLTNCVINGKTVLATPNCHGTVADILVEGCDFGGEVLHYKGKLTLSDSQVYIPSGSGYNAGAIRLADGTQLVIEEDCGKFRHGIGKVANSGYNTKGGDITINGGAEYGYSSSGAGGIVGNKITVTDGNFERLIQGNEIHISGGRYGVVSAAVKVQGGEVHISGTPRFCWSSTVTGDVVSLDGGTIYMDGTGEGSISATTATAQTTIQKYGDRPLSNGHVILTIPEDFASLVTINDSNVKGYIAAEIANGDLKVTERTMAGYSAALVFAERASVVFIFDTARVQNAIQYCKKSLTFTFDTPYGELNGSLSELVYNTENERYEVVFDPISADDFGFEYDFTGELFAEVKFSVLSIADAGAVEHAATAFGKLYAALADYGRAAIDETVVPSQYDPETTPAALLQYSESLPKTDKAPQDKVDEAAFGFDFVTLLMGDTIGIRFKSDCTDLEIAQNAKVFCQENLLNLGTDYRVSVVDGVACFDFYVNVKNFETILTLRIEDGQNHRCLEIATSAALVAADLVAIDMNEDQDIDNNKLLATVMLMMAVNNVFAA